MSSFTYEGDPTVAAAWLAFARSQQTRMAQLGSPGWNIQAAPDVLIMIRTKPEHIHIVVGGGNYHFIFQSDTLSYAYYLGFPPRSGRDVTNNAAQLAKTVDDGKALTVAAPSSDRHAWYSERVNGQGFTVLSGYGTQYSTNRAPHIYMDYGTNYLGYVALFRAGKLEFQSTIAAYNGFKMDNVLVGINMNGVLEYCIIGEAETYTTNSPIGDIPNVPATAFPQHLDPAYLGPDTFQIYYHEYAGHQMVAGFEQASCYWSVNKQGTKAVGVTYANFNVTYEAYKTSDDSRYPSGDEVRVEIVPFLIELSFELVLDAQGIPTVNATVDGVTQMDFEASKQFLIAADFYYYPKKDPDNPQPYEPEEDELILLLAERYNAEQGGETWIDGEGKTRAVRSDNCSLVIKSKTTEYIRDMHHYNRQLGGLESDPSIPDWVEAQINSVDLRSLAYVVCEIRRSDTYPAAFIAQRTVFRGQTVFTCELDAKGEARLDTIAPYNPLNVTDTKGSNHYHGFWVAFVLGEKMAANPFDDGIFTYYKRGAGADAYILDTYSFFSAKDEAYKTLFNYHLASAGGDLADKHCVSNVWVI